MKKLLKLWFAVPLIYRILGGFALGIVAGLAASCCPGPGADRLVACVSPFGTVFVSALKMVVIPVIFFSLALGAARLPLGKAGRIGGMVVVWYLATSVFAGVFGIALACLLNPKMARAAEIADTFRDGVKAFQSGGAATSVGAFLADLFQNPFAALAQGQFLPVILFAILFGLAACVLTARAAPGDPAARAVAGLLDVFDGIQRVMFKITDWVMEYFPFGVFALTLVNFAKSGADLFGPYMRIVLCVAVATGAMIFVVYPAAVWLFTRENPYRLLARLRPPLVSAFVTRSSVATLPVSMRTARAIGVPDELASFSLPLGCTVNMDGICVILPVFAILAGNLFGVELTAGRLAMLLVSVVFASIGAGGIPGGSVFLLFMVLENMGLAPDQVMTVVALALGINPIVDMFETACNVTGDNVCTYIVARRNEGERK